MGKLDYRCKWLPCVNPLAAFFAVYRYTLIW